MTEENPFPPVKPVNVHGTELLAGDTREQYRQKLARITLDSMVQFVGLLDARGTVLEINQAALDGGGLQLFHVEGKPFWTTFWWQVSEETNRVLRDSILRASQGEFVRWDTEIYGRAGGRETIVIDASLCPVKDEHGNVVFITAEGRDITEKKAHEREIARQREELAKLDVLKTQFFSNISHEFRTPLTLMMGALEDAIASPGELSALNRERLELAHRNSLRLLKLVNTLLEFSRIEAGRIQASFEPVELAAFTADLASVFRSATERAGLRFTVSCPPLPEPVHVDRDMWEKIVLNLVSNAFKFTFEGEIELMLRPAHAGDGLPTVRNGGHGAQKFVLLTVRDTGVGIPEEALPRIFERFYRVERTRSRTQEGTGIGLALVQELVKLHGGFIRAESRFGAGTKFTIAIPFGPHLPASRPGGAPRSAPRNSNGAKVFVDEAMGWLPDPPAPLSSEPLAAPMAASPAKPAANGPAAPDRARGRVLLADDNADMRGYLARLLAGHYDVEAVRDGMAALETARRRPPDLILGDVMMPNLDGFALVQKIRADPALKSLPVILLSARAGEESRVDGLEKGADDYLIKPFSARELLARVSAQLGMARLRRETTEALHDAVAANRAKDEFLATLSHELRTPLNPVLLVASDSAENASLPESVRADFKMVAENVSLQARLIDDLLDFSRIVHGKTTLDQRRLDLHAVVRDAVATIHGEIAAKQINLKFSLNAPLSVVDGDPVRLRQVFWNVLKNAVKFTPAGGRIEIGSSNEGAVPEIAFRIRDSGIGMQPEELAGIFQPFVQGRHAGNGRHETYGGLGLGLAVARMLVERHCGGISAESPGPDRGSTIIIRLPLKVAAMAGVEPAATGRANGANPGPVGEARRVLRVLFVDDHEPTRTTLTRLLERRGYHVVAAHSVADALQKAAQSMFDVLISDLGLPDGDGCDLMGVLRQKRPALPGIAMSGFGMDSDLSRSQAAGFAEHLTKPVNIDSLDRALARVLKPVIGLSS